jgi:Domain of unknown function (DUF4349)
MTPSSDLIRELQAARPTAPADLRVRVREIAAQEAAAPIPLASRFRLRLPARRYALVALPAAATIALALTTAGILGVARSDAPSNEVLREELLRGEQLSATDQWSTEAAAPPVAGALDATLDPTTSANTTKSAIAPDDQRAQQVSATLTVEVDDSNGVSSASQKALDLTRRLGGHVLSASVVTGDGANATIAVRVPVDRVQEAVVGLSALGTIVSQQVSIQDLQSTLDQLERRERSVRTQIALIVARLESDSLDAVTRARLETRLKELRTELRILRRSQAGTRAEARMATIQFAVVTPEFQGGVAPTSRVDRTLDEALNVLAWEGVIALAIAIVIAPFALVAFAAWLGRKLYRRREEERLLAT